MGRSSLERTGPRRRAGEQRDATLTAEHCAYELRELARRWDEPSERDLALSKRWHALRLALTKCPDDAYGAARDVGAELLERSPIGLKCALIATFPTETAWAEHIARELAASPAPPTCAVRVLVALADPTLALELSRVLMATNRAAEVAAVAYEMIASMGDAAGDVLIAIADESKDPKTRSALVHAIATIKTERVAAWMASHLGETAGRRAAAAFFRESPDLARALEGAAKKRSAEGRAAKTLMAMASDDAAPASSVAPAVDVPDILRDPPWRNGAAKKAGGVVEDVALAIESTDAPAIGEWQARSGHAWAVAFALFERPELRELAKRWLGTHPRLAALGLIPMAVGSDARRRTASRVLRMLRDEGHGDAITEAARRYGADVERAVAFVLSPDPRLDVPVKPPAIMKTLRVDALPPPRSKAGAALSHEAARNLVELLAIASDLVPYVGCDEVRDACDARSLEEFSWGLFEAWIATGSATKVAWPLFALGVFGGDAVARDLGPRLRGLAQQRKNARASDGVSVLEAIASRGSDVAVIQLVAIAEGGVRSDDLKKTAEEALDHIATARGLDRERLADRLALGDVDTEDALRAQTRRFERALRTQRAWSHDDFTNVVLRSRVLVDLARRLLWRANGVTFRVAEDGALADASDRPVDLSTATHVVLAHPLELDETERARWGNVFADYELVQPFPQIGRETFTLDAAALASEATNAFASNDVPPSRLFALEHGEWTHVQNAFIANAGSALYLSFVIQPGFIARPLPPQSVGELRVFSRVPRAKPKLGDVDRITLSEILRDVASLAG